MHMHDTLTQKLGSVAFYGLWPGNKVALFLQLQSQQKDCENSDISISLGKSDFLIAKNIFANLRAFSVFSLDKLKVCHISNSGVLDILNQKMCHI